MSQTPRRGRQTLGWLLGLATLGLGVLIVSGLASAVADPLRRETTLALPGICAGTPPYRVALLSDIHFGNRAMTAGRLARIVTQVNAAQPDLVVIVGDFVNGRDRRFESDLATLTAPLSQLRARDGVVATLGNHDHWTAPQRVRHALAAAKIEVLANRPVARGPVTVLGLDDDYSGHADLAAAMALLPADRRPVIAITHSPDIAARLPSTIRLALAGHTHCGQVVLPGIGSMAPLFGKLVGDRHYFNPRYLCGVVREGPRTTIVTAGLGSGTIPVRIGAPPDWWLVKLAAPEAVPMARRNGSAAAR